MDLADRRQGQDQGLGHGIIPVGLGKQALAHNLHQTRLHCRDLGGIGQPDVGVDITQVVSRDVGLVILDIEPRLGQKP